MKNLVFVFLLAALPLSSFSQIDWVPIMQDNAMQDVFDLDVVVTDSATAYAGYFKIDPASSARSFEISRLNQAGVWDSIYGDLNVVIPNPVDEVLDMAVVNDTVYMLYLTGNDQIITYKLLQISGFTVTDLGTTQDLAGASTQMKLATGSSASELYLASTKPNEFNAHYFDFNLNTWDPIETVFQTSPKFPRIFAKADSVYYAFAYEDQADDFVYAARVSKQNLISPEQIGNGPLTYYNSTTMQDEPVRPSKGMAFLGSSTSATSLFTFDATANGPISFNINASGGGPAVSPNFNFDAMTYDNTEEGGYVMVKDGDNGHAVQVYRRDHLSGAISSYGSQVANIVNIEHLCLGSNNINRRKLALYKNNDVTPPGYTPYISNSSMVLVDAIPNDGICGLGEQAIFELLEFEDLDFDSLAITAFNSSNGSVLSNDAADRRFEYVRTGSNYQAQVFGTFDDASISAPTQVTIFMTFSDGYNDTLISFDITVNPSTPISQIDDIKLCLNGEQEDLYDYFGVSGGTFTNTTTSANIPNILNPGDLGSSAATINIEYVVDTGCYSPKLTTIQLIEQPTINIIEESQISACGQNDGAIEVSTTAGSETIVDFYWSNGSEDLRIEDLTVGTYVFTVFDGEGCLSKEVFNLSAASMSLQSSITDANCHGTNTGAITVSNPQGLNGPANYLWSNGFNTPSISNLVAGTYTVQVYDTLGCEIVRNYTVGQPQQINFEPNITVADCGQTNGSITAINQSGGVGSYSYLWSTGSTLDNITNVGIGNYTLLVTDDSGCSRIKTFSMTEDGGPILFGNTIPAACNNANGGVNLTAIPTQGGGNMTYEWTDENANVIATSQDIFGYGPGIYDVLVTDDNGCRATTSFDVVVRPPAKNPICVLDVDRPSNTNLVIWEKLENTGISHYNIYRETATPNEFLKIDSVLFSELSVFNDVIANPVLTSWRYRISAVNDCGVEGPLSAAHKTIHMTSKRTGPFVKVNWDYYQGQSYDSWTISAKSDEHDWEKIVENIPVGSTSRNIQPQDLTDAGIIDTTGLDFDVEFDLSAPCTATKAEDFRVSRSNRTSGLFAPGFGNGNYSTNGISEITNEAINLYAYPNPVKDALVVKYEATHDSGFEVLNLMGQVIDRGEFNPGKNNLSVTDLPNGVYIIRLTNGSNATIRIVKN